MGFKSNQSEAFQNGLKPEGDYECIITAIEERTTKKGSVGLNFTLVIRNDVQGQKYGNSCLFHTIWKKHEPNENDMQVEGYNFAQLMAMGKAAKLPDGKERECIDFVNPTKYPECKHKFKSSASKADSFAAKQTGFATPKTNTQADSAIGSLEDFEDVLTDDGVPF